MAAAGSAAVLAGCGGADRRPAREPDAQPAAASDLDALRLMLSLEYFAVDFYEALIAERRLESADADIVRGLGEDEAEHVDALEGLLEALGGRLPGRPLPDFDRLLAGTPDAILDRAAEIENLGAAAYLGQIPRVRDTKLLEALLAIHTVEGRHAAGLDHRLGRSVVPEGPLARPLDPADARLRLAAFEL